MTKECTRNLECSLLSGNATLSHSTKNSQPPHGSREQFGTRRPAKQPVGLYGITRTARSNGRPSSTEKQRRDSGATLTSSNKNIPSLNQFGNITNPKKTSARNAGCGCSANRGPTLIRIWPSQHWTSSAIANPPPPHFSSR